THTAADAEDLAHVEVLAVIGPVAERPGLDQRVLVDEPTVAEPELVVAVVGLVVPRALLQDAHPGPGLGQHGGRDPASRAGPHHEDVETVAGHALPPEGSSHRRSCLALLVAGPNPAGAAFS